MDKFKRYKTFSFFLQNHFPKNTGHSINCYSKKFSLSFSNETQKEGYPCLASKTSISEPFFFNFSFDKSRLKNIVSWFFGKYGQYKTILFLEKLKEFGFGYATTGGISLGIDDLKIPDKKIPLIYTAETKVAKDLMDYRNAKITGIERTQRLIYTWNQTNDMLKQEVLKYFETMDLFNPIYMMAFSGARGNMSQVRQLVGMRGLMSDPQGQIIDFPIQSNFCEGLTLTEYLISTYGARKGIVDTALRTATAGYLTRRLVDVAQHVIVSQFDCGTFRGIFLFDMKEANKTIYSFQNRLIGRVLAQDIFCFASKEYPKNPNFANRKTLVAARNQEIDSKLAFAIAKVSKKALVRSPLTCETPRFICQLCYGWSLSQSKLVAVGEAVGVIAAQSIGEPGTQLTMRTFHTGGVFAGGLTNQILAPFHGRIQYVQNIPGSCIRTSLSEIAFLTKMPGSFFVVRDNCFSQGVQGELVDLFLKSINYENDFSNLQIKWKQKMQNVNVSEMYKIPAYAVLYLRNNERVCKKQILAQFSTVLRKSFQYGSAEQTFYSNLAGEFILNGFHLPFKKSPKKHAIAASAVASAKKRKKIHLFIEKRSSEFLELSPIELKHDILWKSKNWTNIWILSGKILYSSFLFPEKGDLLKKTSVLNRILWKKKKNWDISFFLHVHKRQKSQLLRKQSTTGKNYKVSAGVTNWQLTTSTNKKQFFIEQNFKKTTIEKFCSSFPSSTKNCFVHILFKNSETRKNKILLNKNVYSKNSLISCVQAKNKKIIYNTKLLPFSLFFLNISSSPSEEKEQEKILFNKKLNKSKNDILFYRTFQKIFFYSSLGKQRNFSLNNIVYTSAKNQEKKMFKVKFLVQNKNLRTFNASPSHLLCLRSQKKHLKQVFFKFATSHRTTPFFQFSSLSQTFNTSIKFVKIKYTKKFFLSVKLPFLKHWSNKFALDESKQKKLFKKKLLVRHYSSIKQPKNFLSKQLFHKSIFPNIRSLVFKNLKISQNFEQSQNLKENLEKQILFKRTVFSLSYTKIRYNKYGYVFSFHNSSKNKYLATQENAFQIFSKLKQPSFDKNNNITNPGKQETNISFGNGNFIGKDFPAFFSYFFPKNYQTITNGIFTLRSFEKNSKKQRYKQFFCLKQKNRTLPLEKSRKSKKKYSFLQMSATTKQKLQSTQTSQTSHAHYLQNQTFHLINKKTQSKNVNLFENSTKKNTGNYFFVKNSKKKIFEKTFSLFKHSLENQKVFITYGITSSEKKEVFSCAVRFLRKYNFIRFSRSEFYTEEIFWIPQENYTFPILDLDHLLPQKSWLKNHLSMNNELFSNGSKMLKFFHSLTNSLKTQHLVQNKKNEYISRMIFKKNPLFYLSNSQGKKKLFFSVLEGIWNYSISLNKLKYRQFSPIKHKKILISKKFHTIQQKFSFYKFKKEKTFKNNFSIFFLKKSSIKFLKLQSFRTFGGEISSSFFCNSKKSFILFYGDKISLQFLTVHASRKKKSLKSLPTFHCKEKIKQSMQKNFLFSFQKRRKDSNFEKIKNLFFFKYKKTHCFSQAEQEAQRNSKDSKEARKKTFSCCMAPLASNAEHARAPAKVYSRNLKKSVLRKKIDCLVNYPFSYDQSSNKMSLKYSLNTKNQWRNIQAKIGKKLKNQCFTCIPFKKTIFCPSTFIDGKNIQKSHYRFLVQNPFILQDQQLHLKIQSGWICIFPNSSSVLKKHQRILNLGHFFGKDFCFEQNKILQEVVIFEIPDSFSDVDFISANEVCAKIPFCLKLLKKNQKSRFSNDATLFANQNLASFFVQKTPIEKEKLFNENFHFESSNTNVQKPFLFNKEHLISQQTKFVQKQKNAYKSESFFKEQKKIALFIRPMQYRLLENPKNYKKFFLNKTMQTHSFISSVKIYKKYHSILLNIQKPNKHFIQNIENIESKIKTDFQKIYSAKHAKRKKSQQSNKNKYTWSTRFQQKHPFLSFDFSKNFTKVPHIQLYSKKTKFFNFQNLLTRNTSKFLKTLSSQTVGGEVHKQQFMRLTTAACVQKTAAMRSMRSTTNCYEKMFFSFYPIQFLPLSISNSSLNIPYFERKNSQLFSTIFYNFLNNKISFSLCHKKAAFFNQRFHSFDFRDKTSSFWLKKNSKNIFFLHSMKKNFWNRAFLHSIFSKNASHSLKKKRLLLQSNIHIKSSIFKNFIFQKNQNFYANTQFLSPFDGELISMFTNELNWWKKASEISTIQNFNTLFSVISKKDLFTFDFANPFKNKKKSRSSEALSSEALLKIVTPKSLKSIFAEKNIQVLETSSNNEFLFGEISKYSLKTKQKHLTHLYKFLRKTTFDSLKSTPQFVKKNFSVNKIIKTKKFVLPVIEQNNIKYQISSFVTKYENKIYKFKNFIIGYGSLSAQAKQPRLGKFLVAGDCLFNFAIRKPGQVVHLSTFKTTLRRGQPFLVSPKGILHLANTPYIEKNVPILTLSYQTLQSGDIVQGIPKVEQYFEARTTIQGRLFISSLPILLKGIFQRYKVMLPLEQAVQQSFLKIQQLIVDGVQRVYRLQGVSIVDKHLEVIVRQMTTKVQIIHGAQTGFFPGELVSLELVERINQFLLVKVRYEPIVLGITRASLEVDSFLSASSFQQTTKILALASISRKKDFLKGLKENILVGSLIPSGTGYLVLGTSKL